MKTTNILLLIVSFFFSAISSAQKISLEVKYSTTPMDNNTICYSPGNKLVIEDFTGKPDENNSAVAITSSGFSFKASFRNDGNKATMIITVSCNFDKHNSWMKQNGKNAYILGHEQHHFDITYLGTQEFISQLKQQHFTTDNYSEKLKSTYEMVMNQMEQMQHQYDNETKNGQLKDAQLVWNKKIGDRLIMLTAN